MQMQVSFIAYFLNITTICLPCDSESETSQQIDFSLELLVLGQEVLVEHW